MKVLGFILALVALQCVLGQRPISASFNQTLSVNSTANTYGFLSTPLIPTGAPLTLTVSSASAQASSNVSLNVATSLPIGLAPISISGAALLNGGLPAGYAAFSLGNPLFDSQIGAGLSITFTADINGNANALLVLSPITLTSLNATLVAAFRPLTFDASTQTYAELPANQYNVSLSGGIQIYTSRSITLYFSSRTAAAIALNVTASAVVYANLVANTATSFAITEGNKVAFTIYNLTAAAGTFAIRAYNNATTTAGNIIISSIYSLNHSAGANAQVSASLQYDTAQSGLTLNSSIVANAAWYVWTNGVWARQSSTVSGTVVIYNTNHFSDWSVQSGGNTTSSTTTTSTGGGNQTGASSKMSSIFSTMLKFLF